MKLFFTFLALSSVSALTLPSSQVQFQQWTEKHGKEYASIEEENARFEIFEKSLKKIEEINNDSTKTWTAGLNKFSDLTWDEFKYYYLMDQGQNCSATNINGPEFIKKLGNEGKIPEHFDWRKFDAVSPVKDQV